MKPRRTPPRRTFTITLPKDVAELVEAQYLMIRRKVPELRITRTDLVLGYFKYGCLSYEMMFSRFDSMVSAVESGRRKPLNREKLNFLFGQAAMKSLVADAKEAREELSITVRGMEVVKDKPVRAVPKPKDWTGKHEPTKKSKPALRLVKKGTEKE